VSAAVRVPRADPDSAADASAPGGTERGPALFAALLAFAGVLITVQGAPSFGRERGLGLADIRQRHRFRQAEPRQRKEEKECSGRDQDAARQCAGRGRASISAGLATTARRTRCRRHIDPARRTRPSTSGWAPWPSHRVRKARRCRQSWRERGEATTSWQRTASRLHCGATAVPTMPVPPRPQPQPQPPDWLAAARRREGQRARPLCDVVLRGATVGCR